MTENETNDETEQNNNEQTIQMPNFLAGDDFDRSRFVGVLEVGTNAISDEELRANGAGAVELLAEALDDLNSSLDLGDNPLLITGAETDATHALYDLSTISSIIESVDTESNEVALEDDVNLDDVRDKTVEALESLTPSAAEMVADLPDDLDIFACVPPVGQWQEDDEQFNEAYDRCYNWRNYNLTDEFAEEIDAYIEIGDMTQEYTNNEAFDRQFKLAGVPTMFLNADQMDSVAERDVLYGGDEDSEEAAEEDSDAEPAEASAD